MISSFSETKSEYRWDAERHEFTCASNNLAEIGFRRANLLEKFVAAHFWHPDIGNDQVRAANLHCLQSQTAIFCFNYVMIPALENTPDRNSKISFVV